MIRVRSGDVGFTQVKQRKGKQRIEANRIVLQTNLRLFTFGGLKGVAVEIGIAARHERRRIADVRRQSVVEVVEQPGAAGGGVIVTFAAAIGKQIGAFRFRRIVPPGEIDDPVIPLQLIL